MKLIVGLGNPGPKYARTRHNLGFMAIDALAEEHKGFWKLWGSGKNSEITEIIIHQQKVILQKPLTFMNISGQAVVACAHFYKILPQDIVIIQDDVDIPFGEIRLKVGGGDGGHNGIKSIVQSLSSRDFFRIRMGIGRPAHSKIDTVDHVLSHFSSADWNTVEKMIENAVHAAEVFVQGSEHFKNLMNTFHQNSE